MLQIHISIFHWQGDIAEFWVFDWAEVFKLLSIYAPKTVEQVFIGLERNQPNAPRYPYVHITLTQTEHT